MLKLKYLSIYCHLLFVNDNHFFYIDFKNIGMLEVIYPLSYQMRSLFIFSYQLNKSQQHAFWIVAWTEEIGSD